MFIWPAKLSFSSLFVGSCPRRSPIDDDTIDILTLDDFVEPRHLAALAGEPAGGREVAGHGLQRSRVHGRSFSVGAEDKRGVSGLGSRNQ